MQIPKNTLKRLFPRREDEMPHYEFLLNLYYQNLQITDTEFSVLLHLFASKKYSTILNLDLQELYDINNDT
jgi:hypothetical protein